MNKIRVKLILELKEKGLSRSDIASSRHISRRSVNEVFKVIFPSPNWHQSFNIAKYPCRFCLLKGLTHIDR